jgi:hypothetical protein
LQHHGTSSYGKRRGRSDQDNFIPFILGRVNKATRDWLDALTAPEPGEQVPSHDNHPWNPQARTTTETVLREAMQALVGVQAHMLAGIVVEIRAADIAVELEPQHTVMSSMLTTLTGFPVAPVVLVFQVVFEIMLYQLVWYNWYCNTCTFMYVHVAKDDA